MDSLFRMISEQEYRDDLGRHRNLFVYRGQPDADFELMYVNDGSKDNTFSKIEELNKKDKRVKCVSFARNFGKEAALFAGIRNAGDPVEMLIKSSVIRMVSEEIAEIAA